MDKVYEFPVTQTVRITKGQLEQQKAGLTKQLADVQSKLDAIEKLETPTVVEVKPVENLPTDQTGV